MQFIQNELYEQTVVLQIRNLNRKLGHGIYKKYPNKKRGGVIFYQCLRVTKYQVQLKVIKVWGEVTHPINAGDKVWAYKEDILQTNIKVFKDEPIKGKHEKRNKN